MRTLSGILLAGMLATLAGCATYKPPVSGDTATVSFELDRRASLAFLRTSKDAQCRDYEFIGKLTNYVNEPLDRNKLETKVAAGKPFMVHFSQSTLVRGGHYNCSVTTRFTPEAGKSYNISYRVNMYNCLAYATEVNTRTGESVPLTSLDTQSPRCDL